MNNTRFSIIFGIFAGLLFLVACGTSPTTPTETAASATPRATTRPSSTPTSTPQRTPRPTFTAVPPTSALTATRIACNLDSPYLGVSQPGKVLYLLDLQDDCVATIAPGRPKSLYGWGSWLSDGSGFVYLDGRGDWTAINICIWDVAKQATTRCLLEGVDYYMQAVWSPNDTNLVAYRRFDVAHEKEFITIASAQSGKVLYETAQSLSPSEREERFLAWHPDGNRMLLAVDEGNEQTAMIVDIDSLSKTPLAQFDADQEYIARGLWINDGQDVVLGIIDPILCCTGEGRPDAQHIYRVRGDGREIRRLVKDVNVGAIFVDRNQRRLLLDTYSNGNDPSPAYWLDWDNGKLTRVFDDKFEKRDPWLLGLTPDGRYIATCDGQYQTWVFDTQTKQLTRLPMEIYDTIEWRP